MSLWASCERCEVGIRGCCLSLYELRALFEGSEVGLECYFFGNYSRCGHVCGVRGGGPEPLSDPTGPGQPTSGPRFFFKFEFLSVYGLHVRGVK